MPELYCLYENAAGYMVCRVKEWEQIGKDEQTVLDIMDDAGRFVDVVSFVAFHPFVHAEEALENTRAIVAGEATELLRSFLDQSLPKKKAKYSLGVVDPALGKTLADEGFKVVYDRNVLELIRGCRLHTKRLVKQLNDAQLIKFQVGLGHSTSRAKLQLDPNRQDKPIQQASALLDALDKNINSFVMRVKEWYSWHFPELGKIVTDSQKYAEALKIIRIRDAFDEEANRDALTALLDGDDSMVDEIYQSMKITMGTDIVETDMVNIERFADEVIKLTQQRVELQEYLGSKLGAVAPNLQTLVGDSLAARLITHAGSLTNLAKYPASTIQILGAEKALFRALKTRGPTPKYGLLFQSSFIGRAAAKNKGRISRYLANKCSLASRIDSFAEVGTSVFGQRMRDQVEERLQYLVDGVAPKKNLDAMREALGKYNEELEAVGSKSSGKKDKKGKESKKKESKKDKKKDKKKASPVESSDEEVTTKKRKRDKKEKKEKKKSRKA